MHGLDTRRVEDILIEAGLLSASKLQEIKKIQSKTGEKIEKILMTDFGPKHKEILSIIAQKLGLDFVDLENVSVNKNAIALVDPDLAAKYSVFPFEVRGNILFLAMRDPEDTIVLEKIKASTNMNVKPVVVDIRLLNKAIKYFYNREPAEIDNKRYDVQISSLTNNRSTSELGLNSKLGLSGKGSGDIASLTVDECIRSIILKSIKINCYDIHLDSVKKTLRIRYRVDGILVEEFEKRVGFEELIVRIKVMAGLFTCDKNVPQKGNIVYSINQREKIDVEVCMLPTVGGESLLLKVQNYSNNFDFSKVGLSATEQRIIDNMIDKRTGLIVVTGLSGSGRTTTCYSLLERISKSLNIITIEKKISRRFEGVGQIEAGNDKDTNILELVNSVVMHDPDVIMADLNFDGFSGDSREILRQLMSTALSGKLVIASMGFPGIYETIAGLINVGLEPYIVGTAIEGIVTQHLVRKVCPSCGNSGSKDIEYANLDEASVTVDECTVCNGVGYKGKVGLFDVIKMDKELRKMIMKGNDLDQIESKLEKENDNFKNNCLRLIRENITTKDEIIRVGMGKDLLGL